MADGRSRRGGGVKGDEVARRGEGRGERRGGIMIKLKRTQQWARKARKKQKSRQRAGYEAMPRTICRVKLEAERVLREGSLDL
jgi:hypothetical protein